MRALIHRLFRTLLGPRGPHERRHWDVFILPAVTLLVVGLILGKVAYDEYSRVQEAEFRLLSAHARNADAQVGAALHKVDRLLARLAEKPGFPGGRLKFDSDALNGDMPGSGVLFATNADGRIVAASDRSLHGRLVSTEPYFIAHRNLNNEHFVSTLDGIDAELFISRPSDSLLGRMAVVFSRSRISAGGQKIGIVALAVDYRFFIEVLQAINPDDSESMTVIFNRAGDILFRRGDPEKFFGFNMVKAATVYWPHVMSGLTETRHVGPSAINGMTRLFIVRDVGSTGLSLILSRQQDEVLARWRRDTTFYAVIFGVVALVLLSLAIVAIRRQRQLLAAREFAEQLITSANVMVVGRDASGRVTIFNTTAERISGYSRQEVLGQDWCRLTVPDDLMEQAQGMCGYRSRDDIPLTLELPLRTKTGQERIISWNNSVIEAPNGVRSAASDSSAASASVVSVVSFGIDVTERWEMDAERERFVAMVSHEFRTPLATIDGAIQYLEMHAVDADTSTRKRHDKIQRSVERLTLLLDDYLLQERLGRVKHGLNIGPVSPSALLADLQSTASALSAEHSIFVDDAEAPAVIYCDGDLIRLSLRVLSDNAVKYTPPGTVVWLICRPEPGGTVFIVRDTGAGIPEDELPHVFDKFFRGRSAVRQSGTGVGLHLAHSVVVSHGGSLTVRNADSGGAEFTLWLPARTPIEAT
jgi:PAS domain S-box-containing protein